MGGPFFFAWVDSSETEFNDSHVRNDEQVLSFHITQSEGDFASLELTIVNPRVGLLAPGRPLWAWFSLIPESDTATESETGSESESESETPFGSVVPLFFGRVLGVPENLDAETITIAFTARPKDFEAQKLAVAESKKVAPFWDSIWFSPTDVDNPDNVLESRPELWHIDRVSHVVSTSSIVNGEDGTITFDESNVFYDSVRINYGQTPLRKVNVSANISWSQMSSGVVNISQLLGDPEGAGWTIFTYTGDQLLDSWPKPGASMGGGWKIGSSTKITQIGGSGGAVWDYQTFDFNVLIQDSYHQIVVPEWAGARTILFTTFPAHVFKVPLQWFRQWTTVEWDANRSKSETLSFTLEADVQAILTDSEDEDVLDLSMSSSEIVSPIDPGGALPIGRVSKASYLNTERGAQSIEYLIAVARAQLIARSRCVTVEIEVPFNYAIQQNITLRKNAVFYDSRLPGGVAAGKITAYSLSCDGDSGVLAADVTFECTVGKGGSVSAIPGTPTYVADGYVNTGYQVYSGQFVMPITGEVTYESILGAPINDDGVDFERMTPARVVKSVTRTGSPAEQRAAMGTRAKDPNEVFTRLNSVPSTWSVELVPVTGGPFQTDYTIQTSQLKIAKTIDLEAAS